ncbi:hypothetical protein [Vibrio sinaloensis]|uniref:hypothetical protein n=1 Tax=Photobacterium sp. (strain ATCC 43367) TaxID=379097 RepID=UPI00205D2627|nr:hypothetical protein [Vibrio sinaloensis]UPQ90348.1 hypothetical protein MTO69_17105 [Vibrio sinaloensis]
MITDQHEEVGVMDFTEKLRLRGKAEEDIYFAQRDRELIEAMHDKQKQQQDSQPPMQQDDSSAATK